MTQLSPATGGGFQRSPAQGGGTGVFGNPGMNPMNGTGGSTAQGADTPLGTFTATAYGPPWVGIQGTGVTADGTNLKGPTYPKIYGVAVDPKVIPLGTYLHIWPNPFGHTGTFKAFDTGGAITGKRIDFYDWRGRSYQNKWGRQSVNVHKANDPSSQMDKPATGGGIHISNPLNAVDDMAKTVKAFVDFLLSPKSIGELLAKIAAMFAKTIFKALWQYVIAPVFHWHQRATQAFWTNVTSDDSGVRPVVVISFWAVWYGILWARVDKDRAMVTDPQHTPLGSLIRAFGNTSARRKLVKPRDVKSKTPTKPEPVKSSARMTQVRTLSATRRRTVAVGGNEPESAPDNEGTNDE